MKVLVVGSGGREHTLIWKIAQSKLVDKVYCAPGNGGIGELAECVDIKADDIDGLLEFARSEGIGLTAVSYTHLRAHETPEHLVCRLLLDKKKKKKKRQLRKHICHMPT